MLNVVACNTHEIKYKVYDKEQKSEYKYLNLYTNKTRFISQYYIKL